MAERIRPKFCVEPKMTPRKVYGTSKSGKNNSGKYLEFTCFENAPIGNKKSVNI